jgi:hypothetical protein
VAGEKYLTFLTRNTCNIAFLLRISWEIDPPGSLQIGNVWRRDTACLYLIKVTHTLAKWRILPPKFLDLPVSYENNFQKFKPEVNFHGDIIPSSKIAILLPTRLLTSLKMLN